MTDEVAGVEFAGLENDGLENDGVERHNAYTAYDKVNANECARRVIISRTNPYISYAAFKVIRVLFEGLGATMQGMRVPIRRWRVRQTTVPACCEPRRWRSHRRRRRRRAVDTDCCQRVGRSVGTRSASCCRHTITVL